MSEYFDKKGFVSASFLKALSSSPKEAYSIIRGEESKKTPSLDFGSLVDCLLTTPDEFINKYVVFNGRKPTDKLLDFADKYIEIYQLEGSGEDFSKDSAILRARTESGYDSRLLNETVLKKFRDECDNYCQFYIDNSDKTIIDTQTLNFANELVSQVKSSPYLQHIFYPTTNRIILFQVPIYIVTTKFEGKALIDILDIDLETKIITPYDLKTFEGSFESNYWKYKYYYQEAWYSFILNTLSHEDLFVSCEIPEELKIIHSGEYKIEQFKFIAVDKSMYREVEVFQSYRDIVDDIVFRGYIDKGDSKVKVKSIVELVEEAKDRVRLDNWTTDYQMLTNGVKRLWL